MSLFSILFLLLLFLTVREIRDLSFLVLLVLTFVFLTVSSLPNMTNAGLSSGLLLVLYLIVSVFVSTHSLLVFFIMYEFSLYPVCLLILLLGYQPEKLGSMLSLLLYTVVCSAPFLYITLTTNLTLSSSFASLSA